MIDRPLRILIADDDERARRAAHQALRAAGIQAEIQEAPDCASTLAALRRQAFDCACLDYQFPDGDGALVLREVRKAEIHIPIIMLIGNREELRAVEWMKAGASDYLPKSRLTPESLAQSLRSVLRLHEAQMRARQAEEALRANRQWLSTILRSIGNAVIATDTVERVLFMNPMAETLTGWKQQEAVGRPLREVFVILSEKTRVRIETPITRMLRDGSHIKIDEPVLLVARNGTETPIEGSGTPVCNENRESIGVALIFRDISGDKAAEAALLKQRGDLAALNARLIAEVQETQHRVKNNLHLLSSIVEMQTMKGRDSVPVQDLKQVARHIHSLAFVHDILTQQAREGCHEHYISSLAIMERLQPILQSQAGSRRLRFDMEDVRLSARQGTAFPIVLTELVSNALKYGKSEVLVRLAAKGASAAMLEVCDDGPGFPTSFDPARDANSGLELVQYLSRWNLGGQVEYQNRPGGGARVHITLPLPQ